MDGRWGGSPSEALVSSGVDLPRLLIKATCVGGQSTGFGLDPDLVLLLPSCVASDRHATLLIPGVFTSQVVIPVSRCGEGKMRECMESRLTGSKLARGLLGVGKPRPAVT